MTYYEKKHIEYSALLEAAIKSGDSKAAARAKLECDNYSEHIRLNK